MYPKEQIDWMLGSVVIVHGGVTEKLVNKYPLPSQNVKLTSVLFRVAFSVRSWKYRDWLNIKFVKLIQVGSMPTAVAFMVLFT